VPSAGRDVAYTVCNDANTLAWLGNQAALEFHPAPVRRDRLERPDLFVVDIDPPDDAFDAAVEVTLLMVEILDDLGLVPLVKTTGGKGCTSSCRSCGTCPPSASATRRRGSPLTLATVSRHLGDEATERWAKAGRQRVPAALLL
jgi:DNA primase